MIHFLHLKRQNFMSLLAAKHYVGINGKTLCRMTEPRPPDAHTLIENLTPIVGPISGALGSLTVIGVILIRRCLIAV